MNKIIFVILMSMSTTSLSGLSDDYRVDQLQRFLSDELTTSKPDWKHSNQAISLGEVVKEEHSIKHTMLSTQISLNKKVIVFVLYSEIMNSNPWSNSMKVRVDCSSLTYSVSETITYQVSENREILTKRTDFVSISDRVSGSIMDGTVLAVVAKHFCKK